MSGHRRSGLRTAVLLPSAVLLAGCMSSTDGAAPHTGSDAAAGGESRFAELAERSFERGQYAAAARFYRESADQRPDTAKPYLGLGRALMKLQRPRKAADAFRSALESGGAERTARLGLGRALTAADQPGKAVEVLEPLADDSAGGHAIRLARGVAFDLQGKHAQAQASYGAGLEATPSNLALRNNLGLSKVLAGDVPAGIAIQKEAASRRDATTRTRQNLALAYGLAGRMDKAARTARQDLDRAGVEQNLKYYEALHALWREDAGTGNAEAAQRLLKPAAGDAGTGNEPAASTQSADAGRVAPTPPPKPTSKPAGFRPLLAPRPDGEPIQLAAALGGSGENGGVRVRMEVPEGRPEAGDAQAPQDKLSQRIRAAARHLIDEPGNTAALHWIQLASLETEKRAVKAQTRIAAAFPKFAKELPLALQPARLSHTKRVHRLRAGPFADGDAPDALCRALRERGQACLVVRR